MRPSDRTLVYRFYLKEFEISRVHFRPIEIPFMFGIREAWFTKEEQEQLDKGFEIIEDKLFLYQVKENDLKFFRKKEISENDLPKLKSFYFEWRSGERYGALDGEFPFIIKVFTAFTLFQRQQFYVGIYHTFRGEPSLETVIEEYPSSSFFLFLFGEYSIPITDMPKLIEYTRGFVAIDFSKETKLRDGLMIFNRMIDRYSTLDLQFLALFQGFETLFHSGEEIRNKREAIAKQVVSILHKEGEEAMKYRKMISDGYRVRNSIAHGETLRVNEYESLFLSLFGLFCDVLNTFILQARRE